MKIIIALFLTFVFCTTYAAEIKFNKNELIKLSAEHFEKAITELHNAESICWYIPQLDLRKKFSMLLGNLLASTQTKDLKAAILVISLPILAEILGNMNDQYNFVRDCLTRAEYHLRMFTVYNNLSTIIYSDKKTDSGTVSFLEGIDYLTHAIAEIQAIHPRFGPWKRDTITWILINERNGFVNNQENLWKRASKLYEEFSEIVADLHSDLKKIVFDHIDKMYVAFRNAEYYWLKHLDRKLLHEERKTLKLIQREIDEEKRNKYLGY